MPELTLRRLGLIVIAIVVMYLGYRHLTAKRYATPEAEISAVLDEGAAAARAGRIKDMMALVSDAYHGGEDGGPANRDDLKAYLFVALARGAEVRSLSRDITVEGRSAKVRASMIVIVGGRGLVDGRTGAREFTLELAKEGDDWKVTSAKTGALLP